MNYQDMLGYIFDERKTVDRTVENIVRLNGRGTLFNDAAAAVEVVETGDIFTLLNPESMFINE